MYTAIDYCKIMEHLIQRWRVADLIGLNPKAAEAQEFVCNLPARIRRLAERKAGEQTSCRTGCGDQWGVGERQPDAAACPPGTTGLPGAMAAVTNRAIPAVQERRTWGPKFACSLHSLLRFHTEPCFPHSVPPPPPAPPLLPGVQCVRRRLRRTSSSFRGCMTAHWPSELAGT